jgi:hypothetical protein
VERGSSIFLSYRRSNADGYARLLYEYLRDHFGDNEVFFDRRTIGGGDEFPESLRSAVGGCAAMLVVIARDWLEVRDGSGRRRLDRRNDWVRQEIALALKLGKRIIPVLFEDASMPSKEELPSPLKPFATRQGHWLRGTTYDYEVQQRRLVALLAEVPGVPSPLQERSSGHLSVVLPGALPHELLDRSDRLFGREADLRALSDRLRTKGLTALVARPRMGKSWLLMELGRRLAAGTDQYLVGLFDNPGTSDPVLRAVQDLYARWLQRVDLPHRSIVLSDIADALEGRLMRNQPAESLSLAPLRYEQVQLLIETAGRISGRRIVLFLDAWEKTQASRAESDLLDSFLRRLDEWPECHIVLALRARGSSPDPRDQEALESVEMLVQSRPAQASMYELGEMELDDAESDRLMEFLRREVPTSAALEGETLIGLIDGYPGVIDSWRALENKWRAQESRPNGQAPIDLVREAEAAHQSRYPDLPGLLETLAADTLKLAIRLALLPVAASTAGWGDLQGAILRDIDEAWLDDLRRAGVLVSVHPPGFGHASRAEYALSWFLSKHSIRTRQETEGLVFELAERLDSASPDKRSVYDAIMALRDVGRVLKFDVFARGLCEAAASTLNDDFDVDLLLQNAEAAALNPGAPGAALLALGLMNADADAWRRSERPRADEIFARLRALAETHASRDIMQKRMAQALMNHAIGIGSTAEDPADGNDLPRDQRYKLQDDLFDRLALLARRYPQQPDICLYLSRGLKYCLERACSSANLMINPYRDATRRDQLLAKFRLVASDHPEDPFVRTTLAWGLLIVLNDAYSFLSRDTTLQDNLVEELSSLARAAWDYPPELWEQFAIGLDLMLEKALEFGEIERAASLLTHLRELARWRFSPATTGQLATVLGKLAIRYAKAGQESDAIRLFEQQIVLARALGDKYTQGVALYNLALARDRSGDRAEAIAKLSEAAEIFALIFDAGRHANAASLLRKWKYESRP